MVAEELGHLTARSIPWTTGLQAARACGCRIQLSHGVTYRSPPSWMKFCFRICRGAPLLILFSPGGGGSGGGTHEARPREGRRGLTKDVGPDSHGLLDNRRHVSLREKRSERTGEGSMSCGSPRKHPRSRREGVRQGSDHRGSGRRLEGHRQGPGRSKAPWLPRTEFKFRLSVASPGPLTDRGRAQKHFLTRLRAVLKGQLTGPFPLRGHQERAGRSAPVPTNLPSSSGNTRRSGENFQVLWPFPFSGRFCHSPLHPHCSPGLFRSTRLGQVHLHHLPRKWNTTILFLEILTPALGARLPTVAPPPSYELRSLGKTLLQSSPFFLLPFSPLPDLARRT